MKWLYAILALGAAAMIGLLTYTGGFRMPNFGGGRPEVQVRWVAPDVGPDGEALRVRDMVLTQRVLDEEALNVRSAELLVDRNRRVAAPDYGQPEPGEAMFRVRLRMNSGVLLEARQREADWGDLDKAMASTVRECLEQYRNLRERHGIDGPIREIKNF